MAMMESAVRAGLGSFRALGARERLLAELLTTAKTVRKKGCSANNQSVERAYKLFIGQLLRRRDEIRTGKQPSVRHARVASARGAQIKAAVTFHSPCAGLGREVKIWTILNHYHEHCYIKQSVFPLPALVGGTGCRSAVIGGHHVQLPVAVLGHDQRYDGSRYT